jgi:phosphoglycolate phosphatase-like HAD superfamily hydrolase
MTDTEEWARARERIIAEEYGQMWRSGGDKPVVAIDIDGTLGDYHAHFLWFAERWLGRPMPSATEVNPGMRLSEFMGVPHHVYRECKLAYRQGGLKRFMPAYPFASDLTRKVRAEGAQLWICTTRPYLRHDNIDQDTREWLRRNEIEYDAVIWEGIDEEDPTKYQDLVGQVGLSRIVAVCDDLPEQTADAERLGISNIYVRDQPYNREPYVRGDRVESLEVLWDCLEMDISQWRLR